VCRARGKAGIRVDRTRTLLSMNADTQRRLLIEEASRRMHASPSTVRRYIAERGLPVVKLSPRAIRIDAAALEEWIRAHVVAA
jgi:excisionase family DNA binding protein